MAETIDLSDSPRHRRFWLVLAGWTATAAIMALILHEHQGLPLRWMLPSSLFYFYSLGVLVWIACRAHARFAWWKRRPPRVLATHVALGVVAITIWSFLFVGFYRVAVGPDFWPVVFADSWMYQLMTTTWAYVASLGLGLTVQGFDRERERRSTGSFVFTDDDPRARRLLQKDRWPHPKLKSSSKIRPRRQATRRRLSAPVRSISWFRCCC